jgi:hypothetical protein
VGGSLVRVTAADWKAARGQLDRYLDGKALVGDESNLAFGQTLERLPAESTWLSLARVSPPNAPGRSKGGSYLGLSVALRPVAANLDGWLPCAALAGLLSSFFQQKAPPR